MMAPFDDSADPDLGAACNRLAAWVENLREGVLIEEGFDLTEDDLGMILRHLYATRQQRQIETLTMDEAARRHGRASVPITAKD
jgi:hypothetical protein